MISVKKLSSFAELTSFENLPVSFFQSVQYLQVFAKNFCKPQDLIFLGVYDISRHPEGEAATEGSHHDLIGYGAFEKVDEKLVFLGMKHVLNNQELTDYGDNVTNSKLKTQNSKLIHQETWDVILKWFAENGFHDVQLDYVREDSEIYKFFNGRGNIKIEPQEVAPHIILPKSREEYINGLEYHNRRELRRKMNRLEKSSFAPPAGGATEGQRNYKFLSIDSQKQSETDLKKYFAEFIRLMKLAEDEKQQFMTPEMEKFFWDLVNIKTNSIWIPVLNFLEIDGKNVAAILTFENGVESWAYNSGYDPAYKFYSVGLLVHAFKIKDLIEKGFKKYDFLRGSERYKFDLGGKKIQLNKIGINFLQ